MTTIHTQSEDRKRLNARAKLKKEYDLLLSNRSALSLEREALRVRTKKNKELLEAARQKYYDTFGSHR